MHPLIELSHVHYVAGNVQILYDACWSVRPGERWAVIGPNGAGKTTLLRIAGGYLWPNAGGTVKRLGQALTDLRELRRSIGWVANTQTVKVPLREIAIDTVVSGAFAQLGLTHHRGCDPSRDDYEKADSLLQDLRCADLINKPFGVLSQGEQQAVLVARAAMAKPMLMVFDEPCAGMDPGARERFLGMLSAMLEKDRSTSVVMVTHHVEEIISQIEHVLTIRDGQIAAQGRCDELLTLENISNLYGSPVRDIQLSNGRRWPIW